MEQLLEELIKESTLHKEIYRHLEIDEDKLNVFDTMIEIASKIKAQLSQQNIDTSYRQLYNNQISAILNQLQYRGNGNSGFVIHQNEHWKQQNKNSFNQYIYNSIKDLTDGFNFQIDFFEKIGNFDSNIVIVGANGSGKTSLSEKLKQYLNNNGVVISAQRILKLPTFENIGNPEITATKLKEEQLRGKTYKNADDFHYIANEFEIVLKHLLAENISVGNKYRKQAIENTKNEIAIDSPQKTNLDATIEIWNSLIEHRYLDCEDGINIKTYVKETNTPYPSIQMSDGEKVLLYLIAQVMLAPANGFIVIDEPEMYLHKTILKRLWDILEIKRNDCLFIYLTHDLDFATSRNTAKKIWIKSYKYPNYWEIENIESEEIPQALLFELLGSRKNILFCEGIKGSNDEKIYSMLFPNFTITSVGSCFNVINHTKAFNKLSNINTTAFGLIDSDHHSVERLDKIKLENIFSFSVSEVENLFLDEEFLTNLSTHLMSDPEKINLIKTDVIKELEKEKDLQISNYISTKINNIFTDSDLAKGNTIEKVKENYQIFLNAINIDSFYDQRKTEIDKIIADDDYEKTISVYNNKGLKKIASRHLAITDFTERCFKFIQNNPDQLNIFKKYFPSEII